MEITGLALALQVILEVVLLARSLAHVREVGVRVQVADQASQPFRAAGPYVFLSSQPFFTPVIIAKVNIPVLELSGHASG